MEIVDRSKIRVLDKHVADKIAAGEVVDRPVSIVKELVENAIDAGADSIAVEIREGGKAYIRVTDNGCGIAADEVEIAFRRHATSKISTAQDLGSILTLGFRGEALASICAVSRVEVITKTADAKTGRRVIADGSEIAENSPTGCPDGTTITVRDLFYNVPARYKFLASDGAEARRIIDLVSRIALAYPDIRFRMANGGRPVFNTSGKGNLFDAIVNVYGADIGRDLIPVEGDRGGYHIRGFVSNPGVTLSSRMRQIFCVNGRVVSSAVIEKAIDKAYRERLFQGRFPIAFLFIALPADKLDVNIHPTKKEVRFDDNSQVEDFISEAIAKALHAKEAIPQVRDEAKPEKAEKPDPGEQIDVKKLLSTLREEVRTPAENDEPEKPAAENAVQTVPTAQPAELAATGGKQPLQVAEDTPAYAAEPAPVEYKIPEIRRPAVAPFDFDELSVLGVVFHTYILATDNRDFYMIDQHAAHERVFYEKLRRQYEASEKYSQQLMIPLHFSVSADVSSTEERWLPVIENMGYSAEFFGNHTYLVREIPAFMELDEAENFLNDLFNQFTVKTDVSDPAVIDRIIMRSCKSAVKGGDKLAPEEIDSLFKQLRECINPFSCPHGRPTFVRMTKYEIERMFKRA